MIGPIRIVVVVLSALAALVILGGYLLPGRLGAERTLLISAAPAQVYGIVESAEGWRRWTAWVGAYDKGWKGEALPGPPRGVGARFRWTAGRGASGVVSITAAEPERRVAYVMEQERTGQRMEGELKLAAEGGGTRVTWGEFAAVDGAIPRWVAWLTRGRIEAHMDRSLEELRKIAEAP